MRTGVFSQIHHIVQGRCSAALLGKCHDALASFLSLILNITETSQPLSQQKCQGSQKTLSLSQHPDDYFTLSHCFQSKCSLSQEAASSFLTRLIAMPWLW